jgi:hypothetical protein
MKPYRWCLQSWHWMDVLVFFCFFSPGTQPHVYIEQQAGCVPDSSRQQREQDSKCMRTLTGSRASLLGIVIGDEVDGQVLIQTGEGYFSLFHSVQTGSGAQLPSYPMGTWGHFRCRSVKLTSHPNLIPRSRMDICLHSPMWLLHSSFAKHKNSGALERLCLIVDKSLRTCRKYFAHFLLEYLFEIYFGLINICLR